MPEPDTGLLKTIKRLVRGEAETKRDITLYTQVKFYEYGQRGVIPPEWKDYETAARTERDPEYATYLRLKEKFESYE